jgi:omega-6 fatty acid desaturase (delta-12 desaturase)
MNQESTKTSADKKTWRKVIANYETPIALRSIWQLVNTLPAFFGLWALMYFSLRVHYALTLLLAIPAAGFMVRIFIISHDCGHRSYFKSDRLNNFWGVITSTMTLTPYSAWRHDHAKHHASSGNLDKRGVGDIWTLTVKEYLALTKMQRLHYRIYRNPLILFGVGPLYLFLVQQRMINWSETKRVRLSVLRTNLTIVTILAIAYFTIGLKAFVAVQLPITIIASSAGVWLFYVQHQFEGVYWERGENWDYVAQALEGSSFYKLPKLFQWFSGSIGFHHVHHLSARIPNYLLEKCHKESGLFEHVPEITLVKSLRCLTYRLWDEETGELITFSGLRRIRAMRSS